MILSDNTKEYVLGFAFSKNKEQVILIEKNRPEWQKGKHNGIGGKVEEETGVETKTTDWSLFAELIVDNDILGGSAHIYVYKLFNDLIFQCKTIESEIIKNFNVNEILNIKTIDHVKFLIPFALNEQYHLGKFYIK